jgi:signal peptidase I
VVLQSIAPTLKDSTHYLINVWAFHGRDPQPRDYVVIRDPADHGYSVKRIIAVGGESVYLKDGKVFVNNLELHESYLPDDTLTFTYNKAHEQLIMCGKDQYFVLGDNRQKSIDSRAYGPVPRENILGLLMVK